MDDTLQQLGGLLLGAIPTVIFMVVVYTSYRLIVYKPLAHTLDERRSLTEGAVEKARADVAAAEARTAEYEQRLREARGALFKRQEERRQKVMQARAEAVTAARARAQEQVNQARAGIEQDKQKAQAALQGEAGALASEIIRTVLQPAAQAPAGGRE